MLGVHMLFGHALVQQLEGPGCWRSIFVTLRDCRSLAGAGCSTWSKPSGCMGVLQRRQQRVLHSHHLAGTTRRTGVAGNSLTAVRFHGMDCCTLCCAASLHCDDLAGG